MMQRRGPRGPAVGPPTGPRTTRGALGAAAVTVGVLVALAFPLVAVAAAGLLVAGLGARRLQRRETGRAESDTPTTRETTTETTGTDDETVTGSVDPMDTDADAPAETVETDGGMTCGAAD